MNYQLSHDEYRSLELLRDQLELIVGLLTLKDGELGCITTGALYAFIGERKNELTAVLQALGERLSFQLAQQKEQGAMQYFDWMYALRIANGDVLRTPNGAEAQVTEKLSRLATIDEDMKQVLEAWTTALERVQSSTSHTVAAPTPPAKPRKRERLTAST